MNETTRIATEVQYAARDTRGHRAQGNSVSQAVASLLAFHRHRNALSTEDLTIVQCGAVAGQPATWFVYDSIVEYLDDQASNEISRWWAIVEAQGGSAAMHRRDIVLTLDQCSQAAANFGIDLSCPGCASRFYAGHDGDHGATCETSVARIPQISDVEVDGLRNICAMRLWVGTPEATAQEWIRRVLVAKMNQEFQESMTKKPSAPIVAPIVDTKEPIR